MRRAVGQDEATESPVSRRAIPERAQRLKEVVLLAGAVRANRLRVAAGGAMLQLPVEESGLTLAEHWSREIGELGRRLGRTISVRVMVDQGSALFQGPPDTAHARFCVEKDPKEYRGTGGVLRDLSDRFESDDDLLVLNGTQAMVDSLADQVEEMWSADEAADVVLLAHQGGTPCGLMLTRCEALQTIAGQGFVDMKEQALPNIARDREVHVIMRESPVAMPIRTLADYMEALRLRSTRASNGAVVPSAFSEELSSTFQVVAESARVDPSARIHDSVVMAGARVMPEAVVVRSVIGSGAIVARGRQVVDKIVTGAGVDTHGDDE